MPVYEFKCKKCEKAYESLCKFDSTGKYSEVFCPSCKSKQKTKLVSSPFFAFSNPVGTDKWNNGSTGHDYRFKHNIPKVKAERSIAEAVSHMGSNPYGSDNSSDLNLDTGIHDAEFRKGLS